MFWKIKKKNSRKQGDKRRTRALLDGLIVGSTGYQTFGRALYLVYRQQASKQKKRGQPHPHQPCAISCDHSMLASIFTDSQYTGPSYRSSRYRCHVIVTNPKPSLAFLHAALRA